jgi:hypothetical protein
MPVRRPLFGVHADGRVAWRLVVVGLNGGREKFRERGMQGGLYKPGRGAGLINASRNGGGGRQLG